MNMNKSEIDSYRSEVIDDISEEIELDNVEPVVKEVMLELVKAISPVKEIGFLTNEQQVLFSSLSAAVLQAIADGGLEAARRCIAILAGEIDRVMKEKSDAKSNL